MFTVTFTAVPVAFQAPTAASPPQGQPPGSTAVEQAPAASLAPAMVAPKDPLPTSGVVPSPWVDLLSRFIVAFTAYGFLVITAVSARNRSRDRGIDLGSYEWFDDPVALAKSDSIDLFVELIGGEDGPALETALAGVARWVEERL